MNLQKNGLTRKGDRGSCVYQMLRAIWPSLDARVPNQLPESANITSVNLLCFFIFWFISLPFLYINVSKRRWLFLIKMVMMPLAGIALFIWSVVIAKGFGPIFSQSTTPTGGKSTAVFFLSAITSAIGPQATFALNMGDFCRYAKSPRGALWAQVIMMPVCIILTAFLGVTLASASAVIYNLDKPEWNPLDVIARFDSRAAAFFVGFVFAFATLCTNIAGNTVAFGNDLMALMPKWVDVRRGQFICAVLAVCATPWNFLHSSDNFLNFLNGYSVFLGPMCGIMLCDYWILRRTYLNLEQLYIRHGFYWYTRGWNLRAAAAFLVAIIPGLPGLANSVNQDIEIPEGFQDIYTLNWLVGVVIAAVVYYCLSMVFKISAESLVEGSSEDKAKDWLLTGNAVVISVDEVRMAEKLGA
jgi:NCS1 family nucleobase:cation symporter-1